MKTLILSLFVSFASFCSFAQGNLNFANAGVGVNAPISDSSGAGCAGTAFFAQLWWGTAGTTDSSKLVSIGNPVNFLAGAQAGYFTGGTINFPGLPGGTGIIAQVRAWDAASGSTWAQAISSPTSRIGWSNLIPVTLTQPPTTPPNLVGLGPYALIPIPEPTSFALAGLGIAAALILRRRN